MPNLIVIVNYARLFLSSTGK